MKSVRRGCCWLLILGMWAAPAWSQSPGASAEKSVLNEDVLMRFFEEPEAHFHKARELFFRRDLKGSAKAIRTASGFVRLEGMLAPEKTQESVFTSAARLDQLADGIENKAVRSAKMLDHEFARAHYAMGKNHNFKAMELLSQNKAERAGKQLRAAVHHAEHGFHWSGLAQKDDLSLVFKNAAAASRGLVEKAQVITKEMRQAVKSLNDSLEQLAKEALLQENIAQRKF